MERGFLCLIVASQLAVVAAAAAEPIQTASVESTDAFADDGADAVEATSVEAETVEAGDAEASPLVYGAEVDVTSRYMSRGLAWSVRPVLQPSARVSHHGVTLAAVGNAYLSDETASPSGFSELDLLGRYDLILDRATFSPSVSTYIYPGAPATAELGAMLAYNLDLLTLQTRHAFDVFDNAGGWYADVGGFRSQPIGSHVTLDTTASLAWCSETYSRYYIDPSLHGMHLGAAIVDSSLTVLATDAVYVRLHGTFSRMLEKRIRDSAGEDHLLGGGLALGFAR